MFNMQVQTKITISAAIAHFGRKPDAYGGKAALARALGVTQTAIGRWSGPYLPDHHARTLLARPYRCHHLIARGRK